MLYLVIRDNAGRHAATNTWHQKVDGVYVLTNTVNTARRVALMSDSDDIVPESMLNIEQSLILHLNGATITEGPPYLRATELNGSYRPLYKGLEGGTTIHELRDDGTRCGAVAEGDVEAGKRCVGETVFKFRFNITGSRDLTGGDTHTLVRLRYTIVGHPEIRVDTEPFRLVAKEDKGRDSADVSALLKSLTDSKRLLDKAIRASDADVARQAVLHDCQQKMLQMVASVNQLARVPSPAGSSIAVGPACHVATTAPVGSTASASVAASASSSADADGPTPNTETIELAELRRLVPDCFAEGSSSADGVVTNLAGVMLERIEGRSATMSPSADSRADGDDLDGFINQNYDAEGNQLRCSLALHRSPSGPIQQQPPKRQRAAAAGGAAPVAAADAYAYAAAYEDGGGEEMAFRSCAAPDHMGGGAPSLPPIQRSLSVSTEALPIAAPPAAVVARSTPPSVQRLQSLLRGEWLQTKSDDDPRTAAKRKLFQIVRETLLARRAGGGGGFAQQRPMSLDLAETLDELNDLKEFLDFNGVAA